jgi:hypothetical protein
MFLQAAEFANGPDPLWLIRDVLPAAQLLMLYGASGSGKSFYAIDLAAHIGRGLPWRGKRVVQGRVAYICAEGAVGFRKRLRAYSQHHDVPLQDLNIFVMGSAPNLLDAKNALQVAGDLKREGPWGLVIIDTLAAVTPGANENAGEDMGLFIEAAAQAPVLVIHHSGKDAARGARGWSGIKGALDAELEVVRREDGMRILRNSKQKDGADDGEWASTLEVVNLGLDQDGEAITSCVLASCVLTKPQRARSTKPRSKWGKLVWEALQTFATEVVDTAALKRAARDLVPPPGEGERDRRLDLIGEGVAALIADGWLVRDGDSLRVA